ncbi:MAG: alpha-amylase family glycosyl hydrolase [Chloroflexaceae bacterium]|jgi:neopullulanase|nr:alpha-amylase family glycosyl hydrolase [Chloroflexaceae bacterium]
MTIARAEPSFSTPEWVKHAVFYQIFPERFANGDQTNDPENVQPWGTTPTIHNFMGGDLQGIIARLDYLQNLGVTALYMTPIFHATSNHKYNTSDYFRIDPRFGTLETFHELINNAHQRGMHVVLDGVFNHCGRGFFAFQDILENGYHSPYLKWFYLGGLPINPYDDSKPANYAAWWDYRSLPKFNTNHPPVRQFLLNVARYWIEQGADGWRLDVPNEINDHDFWREFRRVVKTANPDAYIVGEIWQDASPWLDGSQFDAVMNYLFRDLCRDFFAHQAMPLERFAAAVESLLHHYPSAATATQLNLLGSHDTARFLTEAGGDVRRLFPAILFQMSYPGAPCIYYGDEIGMSGAGDPYCRGCFPWEQSQWNQPLYEWTRRCANLRQRHPALRTGDFRTLLAQADLPVYAYARWNSQELLLVALNVREQPRTINLPITNLPASGSARDLISGESYRIGEGSIDNVRIPGYSGVVLSVPW